MLCYAMSCYVKSCYVMLWYGCHGMLCYVMVCHGMLCYVAPWHVLCCRVFMLCYVMICHAILFYVMLCHVMLWKEESSENLKRDLRFYFKIDPTSWKFQNSNVLHLQQKWHVWWDVSGKLCWIWTQMLFMRKIRQTILQNFKFGFKLRFKFCFKLCFREKSNTCSNYRNCEFKLCAGKPVDFGFLNYCIQRNQVIVVRYSEDDIFFFAFSPPKYRVSHLHSGRFRTIHPSPEGLSGVRIP